MADNPESEAVEQTAAPEEGQENETATEPTVDEEQDFTFWVASIPFFIGGLVMGSQYFTSATPHINQLINAASCILIGIFAGAAVNAFAGDKKNKEQQDKQETPSV